MLKNWYSNAKEWFVEYSDNYSKTSGSLWQYSKDEPNDSLADSESFKSKVKIIENNAAGGNTKDVEIIVLSKYLRNFLRTLEILLINWEVSLILTWPSTCVITNSTGIGRFSMTDAKLNVLVLTLSKQDNENFFHS